MPKGFPRPCSHLTCFDDAEVNYHGFWCAKHAAERYGTTPAIESRFAELRRITSSGGTDQTAGRVWPESADEGTARPPGSHVAASGAATGAVPDAAPGSGVRSTSRPPSPEPLSDGDLERLLRANNWDELDLEWALISRLEEDL